MTDRPPRSADRLGDSGSSTPETVSDADTDELLSVLGDEYTLTILSTLGEQSLSAREIADRTDVSRQTVYRRLEPLVDAGVVDTSMAVHPSGHHRQQFRIAVGQLEVSLDGDSLGATDEQATAHGD